MEFIKIGNKGQEINETNFWDHETARDGRFVFSTNAGCIRMLVPDNQILLLAEFTTAKQIVVSRGPWPSMNKPDGFEIMFDDYSDAPFAVHVGPESWVMLPKKNTAGDRWDFAIWTRAGRMYKSKCFYRVVDRIPYMQPWGE